MQQNAPVKNGIAKSEKLNGEPFSTFPTTQNTPKIQDKSNAKQTFFFILNAPFFFVVMIITNNFIIVNMFFENFLYFFKMFLQTKRTADFSVAHFVIYSIFRAYQNRFCVLARFVCLHKSHGKNQIFQHIIF